MSLARIFVEGGSVDGVTILRPDTVEAMMTNQLTHHQRTTAQILGSPLFGEGHGFRLGVACVLNPRLAAVNLCRGGVGTVGWPGAFGGWWQADPTDGTVLVFLTHNIVEVEQITEGIGVELATTPPP